MMLTPEQIQRVTDGGRLVSHCIKHHYADLPVEHDDLRSIGKIGLIKAALTYSPSKGEWKNCACYRIRSEIQKYVIAQTNRMRKPDQPLLYLDAPVPGTVEACFGDIIPDPAPDMLETICQAELRKDLAHAMGQLDIFSQTCILMYYHEGKSQRMIAEYLDAPQIRVSRALRGALKTLRYILEESA